jgi:TonB family protein
MNYKKEICTTLKPVTIAVIAFCMIGSFTDCLAQQETDSEKTNTDSVTSITPSIDAKYEEFLSTYEKHKDLPPAFRFVDEMPEPIGGFDAMLKFIQLELIQYPEKAKKNKITGQVFVEFVIEEDGSISNVKVISGISPELDEEAIRVVSMMPKWKPGKNRGKPVRCFYTIPIRFTL